IFLLGMMRPTTKPPPRSCVWRSSNSVASMVISPLGGYSRQAAIQSQSSCSIPCRSRFAAPPGAIAQRRQVMAHLGRLGASVVGAYRVVDVLIVPGDALMLAQVFRPAWQKKP